MSINYLNAAWQVAPYKAEKLLVLLALADWCDDEGVCFPSYTKIAEKARVSKPGAIQIIQALVKDGAIEITEAGHGRGNHHSYRLLSENWSQIKGKAETVKGKRALPNKALKGNPPLPINEAEKVNQKQQKVNQNEIKGKAETVKGKPEQVPCKEEPSYEPPIEPPGEPPSTNLEPVGSAVRLGDLFGIFSAGYEKLYGLPYKPSPKNREADFGQLKTLVSQYGEKFKAEDWEACAVANYFETPQSSHTLKDLATRYATFKHSALNEFGKPVVNNKASPFGAKTAQNVEVFKRFLSKGVENATGR